MEKAAHLGLCVEATAAAGKRPRRLLLQGRGRGVGKQEGEGRSKGSAGTGPRRPQKGLKSKRGIFFCLGLLPAAHSFRPSAKAATCLLALFLSLFACWGRV